MRSTAVTPVYPPESPAKNMKAKVEIIVSTMASSGSSREPRLQSTKSGDHRTKMRMPNPQTADSFATHNYSTKVIQTPAILIDRNSQR